MNIRTCKICKEAKSIEYFPKNPGSKYGVRRICLDPCYKERNKAYYCKIKGEWHNRGYYVPKIECQKRGRKPKVAISE